MIHLTHCGEDQQSQNRSACAVLGFPKGQATCLQLISMPLCPPHLKYAAAVWDPRHKGDTTNLDMVQNHAVRFILGIRSTTRIREAMEATGDAISPTEVMTLANETSDENPQ